MKKKLKEGVMDDDLAIYKAVFDNSLDAILITKPDGEILAANPAACKLFEMTEAEICRGGRQGIVDLTDPNLERALIARKETGRFFGELNFIKKSGVMFPAEISTAIFKNANQGQLTTMIIRDITDRKIAEEKLKASELEFRSLFENSLMPISQTKPGGGLIRINKAYADLYGYPDITTLLKELTKNTRSLFSDPADREKVLNILGKKGFMPPTEFELKKRNGEKFWALVSAKQVRDEHGNLLYLQAEHIDITNQKVLERKHYLSSNYGRNLIEASLDPLVTINTDGKITDVNRATELITGIKRNKLINSDFSNYFTEPEKAREGYKRVFLKGLVKDYPLTIIHACGNRTSVLYNASLFKNEAGEIQGVFASARDITVQEKMKEELRRSGENLERLNHHLHEVWENEKSQIALNIHDDLGQKLTALNMDLAWIKSRMGIQSSVVRNKLNEMSKMINDFIEGIKEISTFLRPSILFDLGLIPSVISQLDKFEKQSGIKCSFRYYPKEFKIENRLSLILYRIIQESLTNIARHSGATTTVVNLSIVKNEIRLLIIDNGKGIEKGKINSVKSMGLAGIKERVKLINGIVLIKGERGSGTTIEVFIPRKKVNNNDESSDNR